MLEDNDDESLNLEDLVSLASIPKSEESSIEKIVYFNNSKLAPLNIMNSLQQDPNFQSVGLGKSNSWDD